MEKFSYHIMYTFKNGIETDHFKARVKYPEGIEKPYSIELTMKPTVARDGKVNITDYGDGYDYDDYYSHDTNERLNRTLIEELNVLYAKISSFTMEVYSENEANKKQMRRAS